MARRVITDDEKVAIGTGWPAARASGKSQDEYARERGVTARRVREYVKLFGPVEHPVQAVRRIVASAVAELQRVLAGVAADEAVSLSAMRAAEPESRASQCVGERDVAGAKRAAAATVPDESDGTGAPSGATPASFNGIASPPPAVPCASAPRSMSLMALFGEIAAADDE